MPGNQTVSLTHVFSYSDSLLNLTRHMCFARVLAWLGLVPGAELPGGDNKSMDLTLNLAPSALPRCPIGKADLPI